MKISQAAPSVMMNGTTLMTNDPNPPRSSISLMIEPRPVPTTANATVSSRPTMSPRRVATLLRIFLTNDLFGTTSSKSACSCALTAAPRLPMNPWPV